MNLQMKISPKHKEGDITPGSDYRYHPYGGSGITASSTAKLGGDCVFATRFGNDTNGKRLYEYYKSCGISNALMRKDEQAQTGMSISVYSDLETHENFVASGASMRFTKEEIDDAFIVMPDMFLTPLEELGYDEHTVVVKSEKKEEEEETSFVKTLERAEEKAEKENASEAEENKDIPEEKEDALEDKTEEKEDIISSETVTSYIERESLALYALKKAAERKVDMIFQYTPFTSRYPLETLENIKVLVISDEMLYKLTGFFPNNTEKALRSLMALSQKVKAKYYVVQQGNHGAFIYDGSHYEIVSAPSTLVPRNPKENEKRMQQTFMGALAAEYLESKNIVRASKFAVIVSLLTRAKFGNLEKVLSRAEIEQYAQEHGIDLFR